MSQVLNDNPSRLVNSLPSWFRQPLPDMDKINSLKTMFRSSGLHTVCESARCPNINQCWGQGVATFMILGEICTRACRFCAVKAGRPMEIDVHEPLEVAKAVEQLKLRYVVITSVARDDLKDEGATHFADTIREVKKLNPQIKIEVLIPDFSNKEESLKILMAAGPDVVSHNIETVERLSAAVRPQAQYKRSLEVLKNFKLLDSAIITKSSFMLGLGETDEEIREVMKDIFETGCDILTIGQYLMPTQLKRHLPVKKFYTPEEFLNWKNYGVELGFKYVESGPLVRSSFIAEKGYRECLKIINHQVNV